MSKAGEYVYGTDGHEGHWLTGEEVVRCRDCMYSRKDGTLCMFFMSWVPVAGGDEYEETSADVEPDGFCAWGRRIVRCKDCVSSYRDEDGMWCCFYGTGFYRKPTDEGNYCSKGKRRDA